MRIIYKFPLELKDEQTICVPILKPDPYTALEIKKQILKLDMQYEKPCLWIMVDDKEKKRDVKVTIVGTGHPCYEPLEDYVDSFQVSPHGISTLVFHVFVREG